MNSVKLRFKDGFKMMNPNNTVMFVSNSHQQACNGRAAVKHLPPLLPCHEPQRAARRATAATWEERCQDCDYQAELVGVGGGRCYSP